jgi:predicted dienelactone hydrolase
VDDGFVVAVPEHRGDNVKDQSAAGPESWRRRPAEVSRAIDAVGADARFKPLLALDRVCLKSCSVDLPCSVVIMSADVLRDSR